MSDSLLETIEDLSRFQLEHGKFYAQQPREQAVALQRHSRALCALADRWARVDATPLNAQNPYEGPKTSTPQKQFSSNGILVRGRRRGADRNHANQDGFPRRSSRFDQRQHLVGSGDGEKLVCNHGLLTYPQVADLLGDHHRIIANEWQAASMSSLAGRVLDRAVDLLDGIDFTQAALR